MMANVISLDKLQPDDISLGMPVPFQMNGMKGIEIPLVFNVVASGIQNPVISPIIQVNLPDNYVNDLAHTGKGTENPASKIRKLKEKIEKISKLMNEKKEKSDKERFNDARCEFDNTVRHQEEEEESEINVEI